MALGRGASTPSSPGPSDDDIRNATAGRFPSEHVAAIEGRDGRMSAAPDGTLYVRDPAAARANAIRGLVAAFKGSKQKVPEHLKKLADELKGSKSRNDVALVSASTGKKLAEVDVTETSDANQAQALGEFVPESSEETPPEPGELVPESSEETPNAPESVTNPAGVDVEQPSPEGHVPESSEETPDGPESVTNPAGVAADKENKADDTARETTSESKSGSAKRGSTRKR